MPFCSCGLMILQQKIQVLCLSPSFYRSGSLHILPHLCSMHIHEDLQYWGIDQLLMDACCLPTHYPELESSRKEYKKYQKARQLETTIAREEDFGLTTTGRCRSFLWNLTEYPERNKAARVRL